MSDSHEHDVADQGLAPNVVKQIQRADMEQRATNDKPVMNLKFMRDVSISMARWMGDSAKDNMAALVYLGSVDALLYAKQLRRCTNKSLNECVAIIATALPIAGQVMSNEVFVSTMSTIAGAVNVGKARAMVGDMRAWRREYYCERYGAWRWFHPTWWRVIL